VKIESFHNETIRRAVRQEGQSLAQTLLTCREGKPIATDLRVSSGAGQLTIARRGLSDLGTRRGLK
jgi:hypothetical protein